MARRGEDTTSQQRLNLIGYPQNRLGSGSKDQRLINCFVETKKIEQEQGQQSSKPFLFKRGGLTEVSAVSPSVVGEARGAHYFNGHLLTAIGNKLYKDNNTGSPLVTFSGSTGNVAFTEGNSATIGNYCFVADGTNGYVVKSDFTVLTVSNTQIGRIDITAVGTGYTSAPIIGFSGGGGSGAAATAVVAGGAVVDIVITNYGTGYTSAPIIGFSGGGGSGASATATLNSFPTPHLPSITFIDGYIIIPDTENVYNCVVDEPQLWYPEDFLGGEQYPDDLVGVARQNNLVAVLGKSSVEFLYDAANATGSPLSRSDSAVIQFGCAAPYAVFQNERFLTFISQSEMGGRAVWLIDGYQPKKVSDENIERILDEEGSMTDVRGYGVRHMGHMFYVLNLPTVNRTLVYDIEEKLWHEWSTNSSGTHVVFRCNYLADDETGKPLLLDAANGKVYRLDQNVYQDNGTDIIMEFISAKVDFNTYNRKFINRLVFTGEYNTSVTVSIRWTDDDYTTWSGTKTAQLDTFPALFRLGAFRRRAFDIVWIGNSPLRMEAIDLTVSVGTA